MTEALCGAAMAVAAAKIVKKYELTASVIVFMLDSEQHQCSSRLRELRNSARATRDRGKRPALGQAMHR
jgi:hypothetical protein